MRIDKVFLGFFASIAEAKKSNQCSFRAQPKDPILLQLELLMARSSEWAVPIGGAKTPSRDIAVALDDTGKTVHE
ncbi:hypothetical protein Tco_0721144 [Tanacetum coccineum]|uniref:Uncharacterized protein n=1 Tax=Tanacetum coccineum TaxID=301880 RepID=A0ABQ5DDE4_9ASTR